MDSARVKIAKLIGRDVNKHYGDRRYDPWFTQHHTGLLNKVIYWHTLSCVLCNCDIYKLCKVGGWHGVKEDFILCMDCYNKYNISKNG